MEYLRVELGYKPDNINSILAYAKRLCGRSFYDVLKEFDKADKETIEAYTNKKRKGGLGILIEEVYFGYKANSDQDADFPEAGTELKLTPYVKNKNGTYSAGERLVLTMIDYSSPISDRLDRSYLWHKMVSILMIHYFRDKSLKSILDYKIKSAIIYSPLNFSDDMLIIKRDYETIRDKIKAGLAHQLSEADTMYLGACTKGKNKNSVAPQYYGEHIPATKRAFCLKQGYMTYLLRSYILNEKIEKIIPKETSVAKTTLPDIICEKINNYIGKTTEELIEAFNIQETKSKQLLTLLTYRMLGIKNNKAEELIKANIIIKTIRLNEDGKMKENFRMSDIDFIEMANQEWEDSDAYKRFTEEQYLFVVFKGNKVHSSKVWHMPYEDLLKVKNDWEEIRDSVRSGITFKIEKNIVKNSLPKSKGHLYHLRPHSTLSYYSFKDGTTAGSGTISDSVELPDGQRMTRQSDWLSNKYIMEQLNL